MLKVDLDLLISASERCFKYSHVKYIKEMPLS